MPGHCIPLLLVAAVLLPGPLRAQVARDTTRDTVDAPTHVEAVVVRGARAPAVPVVLLILGQRFRRRSRRMWPVFWGAVIGHLLAVPIAYAAAIYPPWNGTPVTGSAGRSGYGRCSCCRSSAR